MVLDISPSSVTGQSYISGQRSQGAEKVIAANLNQELDRRRNHAGLDTLEEPKRQPLQYLY